MQHASPPPRERPWLAISNDQLGDLRRDWSGCSTRSCQHPGALLVAPRFAESGLDDDDIPWPNPRLVVPSGRRKAHLHAPMHARRLARLSVSVGVVVALTQMGSAIHVGQQARAASSTRPGCRGRSTSTSRPTRRGSRGRRGCSHRRSCRSFAAGTWTRSAGPTASSSTRPGRPGASSVTGVAGEVLHPPVRTAFFTPSDAPRTHVLVVARLVPHKVVDVVLEAFRGLDRTLVVAGGGPELERLGRAPPNVRLRGG
ncbi:MAG: hypothetical protein R3C15_12865 [Thermoleophilia bacterium]